METSWYRKIKFNSNLFSEHLLKMREFLTQPTFKMMPFFTSYDNCSSTCNDLGMDIIGVSIVSGTRIQGSKNWSARLAVRGSLLPSLNSLSISGKRNISFEEDFFRTFISIELESSSDIVKIWRREENFENFWKFCQRRGSSMHSASFRPNKFWTKSWKGLYNQIWSVLCQRFIEFEWF